MSSTTTQQRFNLIGGHPALDFINTLDFRVRASGPEELLREYADLVRFAEQTHLVEPEQATRLLEQVSPEAGEQAVAAARVLRNAATDVFDARLEEREIHEGSLQTIELSLKKVYQHRRLVWGATHLEWVWPDERLDPQLPLLELAQSVGELVLSDEVDRVHMCEGPDCGWLFLDRSKAGQRRWCEMKVCGNRVKAQRFRGSIRAKK